MGRCQAITKSGNQCKNTAVENNYCRIHLKGNPQANYNNSKTSKPRKTAMSESSSIDHETPSVTETPLKSRNPIFKPAPDVFGKLLATLIGIPLGIYVTFLQVAQNKPYMALIYFLSIIVIFNLAGRGLDHMIFINKSRSLGETTSYVLPAIFAVILSVAAAAIAFMVTGGILGVIAAIVIAIIVFVWAAA